MQKLIAAFVIVLATLNGYSQTQSLAVDSPYVELIFNGLKKETMNVNMEWLSKLDSIVVMNPNYFIESFRITSCCEKYDYTEYASESNKITDDIKRMFNRSRLPCKFYLERFVIKDKEGKTIPSKYKSYTILLKK